jgi:hypothetical protein
MMLKIQVQVLFSGRAWQGRCWPICFPAMAYPDRGSVQIVKLMELLDAVQNHKMGTKRLIL